MDDDEAFFRDYFASFETTSADPYHVPSRSRHDDLEYCNCILKCCLRFTPKVRLQLRAWYERLTTDGRTSFLAVHLSESDGTIQYRLPTIGTGDPVMVCRAHFLSTLRETADRIDGMVLEGRKLFLAEEADDDCEGFDESEELCDAGCKLKCCKRFPLAERREKLEELHRMPLAGQREFLAGLVCKLTPGTESKIVYFFREGRQLHRVCKTMFLKTYDISPGQFKKIKEKGRNGHVVCGNPKIVDVLRKMDQSRTVFDVDEGLEESAMDYDSGRLLDEVHESILPDEMSVNNNLDSEEKITPDFDEASEPLSGSVKIEFEENIQLACLDIKTEMDESVDDYLIFDPETNANNSDGDYQEKVVPLRRGRKPRRPRTVKPHCGSNCLMQCYTRVPEELRHQLLANLLRMPQTKQVEYIGDHICCMPTMRSTVKQTRRQFTNIYFLPVESQLVKVCKLMFCSTYDLTYMRVRLIVMKKGANKHKVCGNPNFPSLLKKRNVGYYFNYNEVCDKPDKKLPTLMEVENVMRVRKLRCLPYVTISGEQHRPREVRPHCGVSCHMKCYSRIPDELRHQLFADLLRLPRNKQIEFIGNHICSIPAPSSTSGSRRQFSNYYFLPVDFQLVKVCRVMFCTTYDLTDKKIRNIVLKKGTDKHVVCGNPNFPPLLKKGSAGYYFDYDVGCDNAEDSGEMCKCPLQCSEKYPLEVIEEIRSSFLEKSTEEQYDFLSNFVQSITCNKKPMSRARFFLPLDSNTHEVCRRMFLSTVPVDSRYIHSLLNDKPAAVDPVKFAAAHIATYRMDEDHRCETGAGGVRKLSRCPNPVLMYNEYLEGLQRGPDPIEYQQFYGMFNERYAEMGLMLPTRCPDCGFFDRGEEG